MRKVILFSLPLVLLVLATQGSGLSQEKTMAQAPLGRETVQAPQVRPMPPMGPGVIGPRMMGPGMRGYGQAPWARRAPGFFLGLREQLGLSEEQLTTLRSIRFSYLKEATERQAAIRVAELELREVLAADKWDVARAEAKIKEIGSLRTEARVSRLKALDKAREVLSEEQRKKFREMPRGFRF